MKVWLVSVTERDECYNEEDQVKKFDSEEDTLSYLGGVAVGDYKRTIVNSIHSVDLGTHPVRVKKLGLVLEDFKMKLREEK